MLCCLQQVMSLEAIRRGRDMVRCPTRGGDGSFSPSGICLLFFGNGVNLLVGDVGLVYFHLSVHLVS